MQTDEHLGGFISGGDAATFFPALWRWVVTDLGVRTMLDIGSGEGHAVNFFRSLGVGAVGVEGTEQANPHIDQWDFVDGPYTPDREFDFIWSCEFLEHVEEPYARNLIPAFRAGRIVMLTHAFVGQAGHHHVNCQPPEYWRGFFTAAGFDYDQELTTITRSLASVNKNEYNHYLRAGMVFRRKDGV